MSQKPLKSVLIGCGKMGRRQAGYLAELPEFDLAGLADPFEENLAVAAKETGAKSYTDVARMLAEVQPEVVSICTPNDSHAALTIQAAEAGARAVYCEKPMATSMADAREMVQACAARGALLVINHQRRINSDLLKLRELIEQGAVGDVHLIRGHCAGDILSDGTHLIDSIQWLTGDEEVQWVLGQIHRPKPEQPTGAGAGRGFHAEAGLRYGHAVEAGGMAVARTRSGIRLEFYTGDMRQDGRIYQDYEVFGTRGRLWRTGDRGPDNLFIQDAGGGDLSIGMVQGVSKPVPVEGGSRGEWRQVDYPAGDAVHAIAKAYKLLARALAEGTPHPMNGDTALRGFEVNMAIYESARLNKRIDLPFEQQAFPLQLMLDEGRL